MADRVPHRRGDGALLRAELVRAATTLLLTGRAAPSPSLRAIARACGVAPSAVYLHFASQEALVEAVLEEQFARLREALDRAGGADRLLAMASAYVRWGIDHPGAYQLLFERPDPVVDPGHGPGLDLLDRVAATLGGGPDAGVRALRIWAALHGVTSLRLHKPEGPWRAAIDEDVAEMIVALRGAR